MQRWVYALPLLALAWGHLAKAADIEAGKAKAAVCAACHGVEGKALIPNYPHLAGQNAAYAEQQMKDIKSGARVIAANGTVQIKGRSAQLGTYQLMHERA